MPNFNAQLAVGFEAHKLLTTVSEDVAYLGLATAAQDAFKGTFGIEVLTELTAWFDSEMFLDYMSDWHSYLIPLASASGSQTEPEVVAHINDMLDPGHAEIPRFKVGWPAVATTFRGVRYFYFDGRRICLHSHTLLRHDGAGYVEWSLPVGDPDPQVVEITHAWETLL